MRDYRVVWEFENYRIIEVIDHDYSLDDLKGDCFNPKVNPEIDEETLKREEKDFEDLVNREGVYGYILETWNSQVGHGWEHLDSCFGFVGQYSPEDRSGKFDHYIVDELKIIALKK